MSSGSLIKFLECFFQLARRLVSELRLFIVTKFCNVIIPAIGERRKVDGGITVGLLPCSPLKLQILLLDEVCPLRFTADLAARTVSVHTGSQPLSRSWSNIRAIVDSLASQMMRDVVEDPQAHFRRKLTGLNLI